jgi:hypothetical protein
VTAKINTAVKVHEVVLAIVSDDNNKNNKSDFPLGTHFHSKPKGSSLVLI